MLEHAGVVWYRRSYKLKRLSASTQVVAEVGRTNVVKFICHSTASVNLDKYHVEDDLGRRVGHELEKMTAPTQVGLFCDCCVRVDLSRY